MNIQDLLFYYKKWTLFYILLAYSFFSCFAQPIVRWDKTLGGTNWEELQNILPAQNGGFYIAGTTFSNIGNKDEDVTDSPKGFGDMWLVMLNDNGTKQWDKTYGGDKTERLWKILPTTDGNFLLCGESESDANGDKTALSYGGKDYWVVKITPSGQKIWDKAYGGNAEDSFRDAIRTPDGGFLLAGFSLSDKSGVKSQDSKGRYDFWIVKIDANGVLEWDTTLGGAKDELCFAVQMTSDGNYIVGGQSDSNKGGDKGVDCRGAVDFWVAKISPTGKLLWEKTYGGNYLDVIRTITPTKDGKLILAGGSESMANSDKKSAGFGNFDFWILKIDNDGSIIWEKTYGGKGFDFVASVDQNNAGYYMVGGTTDSPKSGNKESDAKGNYDFWITYLDDKGDKIWDETIGGNAADAMTAFLRLQDATYLLGGHSGSSKSGNKSENARSEEVNDFWVVRLACNFKLDLGADVTACEKSEKILNAHINNCTDCVYQWEDGSWGAQRRVVAAKTNLYQVLATTTYGCELEDSVLIEVTGAPNQADIAIEAPDCAENKNATINVSNILGGTKPYQFALNNSKFSPNQVFTDLAADTYKLSIKDAIGCIMDTTIAIVAPPQFKINLPESKKVAWGETLTIEPNLGTTAIKSFQWNYPELQSINITVSPKTTTTYQLIAQDEYGCERKASITLFVARKKDFFTPNVFSPNNDGYNDVFTINAGQSIYAIQNVRIYNRWGALIFEQKQAYPETDAPWDGTFENIALPSDVYLFTAEIQYLDGHKENISGDITLFR